MSKITKNIIALSISSALSIGFMSSVNAATYLLVEEGDATNVKYTYSQQQNINGDIAISGTGVYNFPVQFDYLDESDFDSIEIFAAINNSSVNSLNAIEDSTALRNGAPTANDLAWIIRWLQDSSNDIEYQKVGDSLAMATISGNTQDYTLWDTTFEGTDELTRSTVDIVSGITDSGISYGTGTAPYLPSEVFIDENNNEHTFWLREHGLRGFFSYDDGAQVHPLIPLETQYGGGTSSIMDVNESGIAVGFSSYKILPTYAEFIENESGGCADPDVVPATRTLEACIAETLSFSTISAYDIMAFKATLSSTGSAVVEELGLLVTPHEDDERSYSSYALAVNDSGIAVGYADGFYDEQVITPDVDERQFYQYAVVYKSGNVIDLSGDHSEYGSSIAYDINNAGIAVGHRTNSSGVQKFFYVDTNAPLEQIEMINPDDYFTGSDSTARSINNSGLIVGEGEIETHNESTSNPRRTAAFVYDINNDILTNLNDAIPCAVQQNYDILEARGINDAGVISATAIVKVDRRDAEGEVILDDNGIPLREDVVRAVSLEPVPDTGEVCTAEQEDKVERKGASINFTGLLSIMALFGLRRKFFS